MECTLWTNDKWNHKMPNLCFLSERTATLIIYKASDGIFSLEAFTPIYIEHLRLLIQHKKIQLHLVEVSIKIYNQNNEFRLK